MKYAVVADNSFFSCLCIDINEKNSLKRFTNSYSFFIGNNLKKELPESVLEDDEIISSLTLIEYDYKSLFEPLLGREKKHHNDGEYEAIGIAHYFVYILNDANFRYIIMEDKKGRKFIKNYFHEMNPFLTGTVGFVYKSCIQDRHLSEAEAIYIMEKMKIAIERADKLNSEHRPCSMCIKDYNDILLPILNKLKCENNG